MHTCEHCGKNHANIHIRQIINEEETELYICSSCAEKIQQQFLSFLKVNNFMTNMMKEVKPKDTGKICPQCKFDIEKIRKLGKVGCAHCYEVFEKELDPILNKMSARNIIASQKSKPRIDIDALQMQLNAAVKEENYEKAAELRDKITMLKGESHDNMAKNRT
ncbi:MAG: UvrB/UvrC motif-containing protein [Clostridiales bacterium]|nr:UvrB/UvrC motif-containing protein [Clostridiales bacterium]